MNNRKILGVVLLAALLIGGGYIATHYVQSDEPVEPTTPRYVDIFFEGDVEAERTFRMNGTLYLSTFNANHTSFDNVSVQLFDGNEVIHSECFGRINESRDISISIQHSTLPDHVVFRSPDLRKTATVPYSINRYYLEDGEYYPASWAIPSDLPVNISRHDSCAG